ncbi:EVE domain-containing protein [Blastochloris tepida]|uniref:Ubiquinol-cytochrome c reductase n=1 Tax=Blastochloris tepida TaxID=2233851 RepID=A0A348G4Z3_9HYPH|nr:EVE domain-containing protein [Blastochloris tepida]BBF94626.1 ubiquinol-cytochrome c reductase [Blastochloris tepida]
MAHWLYKSEPFKWSWQDQVAAGAKGTAWDGVRNHAAKLNLLNMQVGDRGFFYHSNEGKEIVGIVEVIRAAYPDPTAEPGSPWVVVDLKAVEPLPHPVPLAAIKATPALAGMALLKYSRLSVQPVTDAEWALICRMGGLAG